MKQPKLIISANDQQVSVWPGQCASCRFYAGNITPFLKDNGCTQGLGKQAYEQYLAKGGCAVWELGSPLDRTEPDLFDVLARKSDARFQLVEVDDMDEPNYIDPKPIDDPAEQDAFEPSADDQPIAWKPKSLRESAMAGMAKYSPNQPRDANGKWIQVGAGYTHPKYGPVTARSTDGMGNVNIEYQNLQGQTRVKAVPANILTAHLLPPSGAPAATRSIGGGSPSEAHILSVIQQRLPAMRKVEAAVKALLPAGVEFKSREKSVQSAIRDARYADKQAGNPPGTTDPANLPDLVGMKAIFDDAKSLVETAQLLRHQLAGKIVGDRAYGIIDPGAGSQTHAKGGYHAVHFNTSDNVEIQLVTKRGQFLAHAVHDNFYNYHLTHHPQYQDFKMYERAVGEHYYRLDQGLPSKAPAPPAIARQFSKIFPDDPK